MSRDSPACRRPGTGLRADGRGQSEVIAVVLILGITVLGTGAIVTLGSDALAGTKDASRLESKEHAMTLFDSRSAMVALGDSPSRSIDLGRSSEGAYTVRDTGWIRIEHRNFTGSGDHETVYNASLGSVVYEKGTTALAYEGGGVWRRTDGHTTMVSPPEFHYRDATLTLPVIRVSGDGAATGGRARVSSTGDPMRVYPNATGATAGDEVGPPYNGTDDPYTNPVKDGHINITVHSSYYAGWADYFRTRTDGNVTVDDANRTTTVQLTTAGSVGSFRMPNEGNGVKVRGIGGSHPVTDFEMTLTADNGGRDFNNLHWSLYSDSGDQQFEYHVAANGKCQDGSYDDTLDVSIYYSDGTDEEYQGWQNQSVATGPGRDFTVDCTDGTLTMNLDSPLSMSYGEIQTTGNDNKWYFGPEIKEGDVPDSTTFDQHPEENEPNVYGSGGASSETLSFLIGHYFGLLGPRFDLTVSDGPGGSSAVDESTSFGRLEYERTTGSRYITYLHITENTVRVEFE